MRLEDLRRLAQLPPAPEPPADTSEAPTFRLWLQTDIPPPSGFRDSWMADVQREVWYALANCGWGYPIDGDFTYDWDTQRNQTIVNLRLRMNWQTPDRTFEARIDRERMIAGAPGSYYFDLPIPRRGYEPVSLAEVIPGDLSGVEIKLRAYGHRFDRIERVKSELHVLAGLADAHVFPVFTSPGSDDAADGGGYVIIGGVE